MQIKHKQTYDNYVKEITSELSLINQELETDIRLKAETLKENLSEVKNTGISSLPYIASGTDVI